MRKVAIYCIWVLFAYNYRFFLQQHLQMGNAEYFPPSLKVLTQSRSNIYAEHCQILEFCQFCYDICNMAFIVAKWKCFRDSRTGPSSDSKFGEVQDLFFSLVVLDCITCLICWKKVITEVFIVNFIFVFGFVCAFFCATVCGHFPVKMK